MGRKRSIQNTNLPDNVYLRVRKRKSGKIVKYYHYRTDNKEILLSVDDYNIALQKASTLNLQKNKFSKVMLFIELATEYEHNIIPTKKPSSQKSNLYALKKLLEIFKTAPLDEITSQHLREYLQWRGDHGAKMGGNTELALFSHIWNYAKERGYTEKPNPVQGIKKFKINKRETYVTDELFTFIYNHATPQLKDLMALAYLTGQRPIDLVNLRKENIHHGYLFLTQQKTGAKIKLELTGLLNEIIQRLMNNNNNHLFTNNKGLKLTRAALTKQVSTLKNKLSKQYPQRKEEIKSFQFRDLRAKCATDRAILDGIEAAQKQLGHTTAQMTKTYIRQPLPTTPLMNIPTEEKTANEK